jgi:DNA polymerase-3 subunit epsilon
MREIVLDTETTGLNPEKGDRIVEIGAIELINHVPTGKSFHTYLNPSLKGEMSESSYEVHGLSADFLSDKPFFSEVVENLLAFIADSKLVIHNASFDIGFINYELQRIENTDRRLYDSLLYKEINYESVIDTLELAKALYPGKSVSLDSLCIKFGINNKRKERHGALIDSEILAEVYLELVGGKQPDFQFSTSGFNENHNYEKNEGKRKFTRSKPLNKSRLSEEEITLHKEFVSKIQRNFWV